MQFSLNLDTPFRSFSPGVDFSTLRQSGLPSLLIESLNGLGGLSVDVNQSLEVGNTLSLYAYGDAGRPRRRTAGYLGNV